MLERNSMKNNYLEDAPRNHGEKKELYKYHKHSKALIYIGHIMYYVFLMLLVAIVIYLFMYFKSTDIQVQNSCLHYVDPYLHDIKKFVVEFVTTQGV